MARLAAFAASLAVFALAPTLANGWSYDNGMGHTYSGAAESPRVICHVDVCDTLWNMGLHDHLVGYFGHSGDALGQDQLCHAGVCMSAHFERMESVLDTNASTGNTLDLEKVAALQPDMIVDYAYCTLNESECAHDAPHTGLLSFGENAGLANMTDSTGVDPLPIIPMRVGGISYLEVIANFQRLATAIGGDGHTNHDIAVYCQQLKTAIAELAASAKFMASNGVRALAVSMAPDTMYLAQPTHDPILIMLEQLGVPMVHVEVNDDRGSYWEWVQYNSTSGEIPEGFPGADVFLYDGRFHNDHIVLSDEERGWTFNHPAMETGQMVSWPIDTSFSYERATRILWDMKRVFDQSVQLVDATECTDADPMDPSVMLEKGGWKCNDDLGTALTLQNSFECPAIDLSENGCP